MIDVERLLGDFLGRGGGGERPGAARAGGGGMMEGIGGLLKGQGGSALSGALAGGLAAQLFRGKGIAKLGGTALQLGGAAVVAGLAYKAYQAYQARTLPGTAALPGTGPQAGLPPASPAAALPSPHGTPFLPAGQEGTRARLMLSAMIAAAKADGYIDAGEERAIFGRIDGLGLDAEEKGFVMDEMRRPLSVEDFAGRATSPEIATEIYTASVLAIDPDHPAERAYLDHLAARLALPAELVAEVRRATDAAA